MGGSLYRTRDESPRAASEGGGHSAKIGNWASRSGIAATVQSTQRVCRVPPPRPNRCRGLFLLRSVRRHRHGQPSTVHYLSCAPRGRNLAVGEFMARALRNGARSTQCERGLPGDGGVETNLLLALGRVQVGRRSRAAANDSPQPGPKSVWRIRRPTASWRAVTQFFTNRVISKPTPVMASAISVLAKLIDRNTRVSVKFSANVDAPALRGLLYRPGVRLQ